MKGTWSFAGNSVPWIIAFRSMSGRNFSRRTTWLFTSALIPCRLLSWKKRELPLVRNHGRFPLWKKSGNPCRNLLSAHSAKITGSRGLFCRAGARRAPCLPELILGRDISDLWNGWGDGSAEQAFLIGGLLSILKELDIVISDRLHICIAGLLAGCRVYFLDNNYGKLSGVYRQSLSDHPRANLLPHSELSVLFPEIFSLVRE